MILLTTYHAPSIPTYGQSATATLSGTVIDQNNAVVPNATITVINLSQGFQRSVTTNNNGVFIVPLLPPAIYIVKAEHSGFTMAEVRDVVLNVNDQVHLTIPLKVGGIEKTVDIVVDPQLTKESASVGTIVDRQFVGNLPLNGRSFQSLITLTPGVVLTPAGATNFNPEQGQFSVNGQRANTNYFTIDSVSANIAVPVNSISGQATGGSLPGLSAFGSTSNLVSVDALQEFRIDTSTFAPEFGRTPGAQVQIATRSGTNDFHGSLFEFFRNDVLDANDWFANALGRPKPAERLNDFGGVLGGPILLPRFGEGGRQPWYNGRNRTFFFFSYEGLRLRQPLIGITDVPSLNARQSAPAEIQPFLNAFPLPTGPARADNFAPFSASFSNPSTLNATSIRIDHSVSNKLSFFTRYNHAPSDTTQRGVSSSLNTLSKFTLKTQTLTAGVTMLLSPTINNDLRANYSRNSGTNFFSLDSFGGATVPADTLFFPSFATRDDAVFSLLLIGGDLANLNVGNTVRNLQRQLNFVDNLSMVAGSHQLKFGVDYRRLFPAVRISKYGQSLFFFGIDQALTGTAFAVVQSQASPLFPVFTNLSLYGQDSWRTTGRLVVTFGLRYELNPPPSEARGNDPTALTQVDNPAALAIAPTHTSLYKTTYNNFAPRLGLSYRLFQTPGRETVLRGGIGVFYDLGNGQVGNAFGQGHPFFAVNLFFFPPVRVPLDAATAAPPALPPTGTVTQVFTIDPRLKLPYVYQFNAAVEQSLGGNQTFSASYVGAIGRRLLRQEKIIAPTLFPGGPTNVFILRNAATSDYHAMQLQFQRRLSRGLQAMASYTWSHSIDIASNDSYENTSATWTDPRLDRGASDFDVRHAFTGALTYDIPTRGLRGAAHAILRDWSIDTIIAVRSATPVNVVYSSFDSALGQINLRPDLVPGVGLYIDDPAVAGGRRINPAAFDRVTPAAQQRQGNLGRNTLRGFPLYEIDFGIRRRFNLTERFNIQLAAQAFNLFNHPNFGNPNPNLSQATFGRSTNMFGRSLGSGGSLGGFNPLFQVGGPRSIQLSIRLQY